MHLDQRDYDKQPTSKPEKIFLLVMSLAFFSMMVMEILTNYEPKKLGAVLFVVFWIPLLFIHEFGHAMMAKFLGWRVNRIVIGVGKVLTQTRFLNAPMEIRMIPLEGFVQIAPKVLQFARLKHASLCLNTKGTIAPTNTIDFLSLASPSVIAVFTIVSVPWVIKTLFSKEF